MNGDFWGGFISGVLACFLVVVVLASCYAPKLNYTYIDIDGMPCIKVNGELISCDWSDK